MAMKCDMAQQNIALAAYGELSDDVNHQLEQHLLGCEECRRDMQAVRGLQAAMSLYPVEEPRAAMLAQARMRLEEALDNMPHGGWLVRITQLFTRSVGRLRATPVMAGEVSCAAAPAVADGSISAAMQSSDRSLMTVCNAMLSSEHPG